MTPRIILAALFAIAVSCVQKPASVLSESSDLKIGQLVGRKTLRQHQADSFRLDLKKDAFVYGYVDQHDVDVIVRIKDSDNKQVAEFDSPSRGPESFKFTTKGDGVYTIMVVPFEMQSGEYSILLSNAEPLATTPEGGVEQFVNATLGNDGKTPGVAIAVQQNGNVVYTKGYGYADIEASEKVTPTTVFHIASVSKQFTAFAIATLADQGKIGLDDDIRKYLPEIHDFGMPITVRQLAHHTSGLRDQWNLLTMAGWRMDDVITLNQVMRLVSKQTELNFKPGDEHLYCNTGFTLMAEIVHRVEKKSFAEWCKENIFDPLDMKNTLFYDDHERIVDNRAYSYHRGSAGFRKSVLSYANAGATSLFTTVEDLSKWAQNFEDVKVGNENIMKTMNSKYVLNNGDTISYAFGQVINKYRGLNAYQHSGGDAGFRSYLLRFPDQHTAISVFSNSADFPVRDLTFFLADVYLKDKFTAENNPPQFPPRQPEQPFDNSTIKLSEYAGRYYSPELETTYTFEVKNDTLISHHQRHDDWKLTATKPDGFNINVLGNLEFYRDKGTIAGFRASNGRVRNLKFIRM